MSNQEFTTEQEYFDFCYQAVMMQGLPSVTSGRCVYRGPNGLKCAIGHLISDDDYDPEMEGRVVWDLFNDFESCKKYKEFESLLKAIQGAHDVLKHIHERKNEFRSEFHERMVNIANAYGLTVPKMPENLPN